MKLVSDAAFYWFIIGMLAFISIGWMTVDVVRMRRYFRTPPGERRRDELFGMCMGLCVAATGLGGLIKHFAGW